MPKRGYKSAAPPAEPVRRARLRMTTAWRLVPISGYLACRYSWPTFYFVLLPPLIIQLGLSLTGDFKHPDRLTFAGIWLLLLGFLLTIVHSLVSYYVQLQLAHNRFPGIITSYRQAFRHALRLIGFMALFGFLVIGGLLCLVVPGLKVVRRYILTPYFIMDHNVGIREAMQQSAAASKPYARSIWSMLAIVSLFSVLTAGLQRYYGPTGASVGVLLTIFSVYLPALRYRECALQLTATSVEDQPGVTVRFVDRYRQFRKIGRQLLHRPR